MCWRWGTASASGASTASTVSGPALYCTAMGRFLELSTPSVTARLQPSVSRLPKLHCTLLATPNDV